MSRFYNDKIENIGQLGLGKFDFIESTGGKLLLLLLLLWLWLLFLLLLLLLLLLFLVTFAVNDVTF